MKLKQGDTVRVVGSRGTTKIRAILSSMHENIIFQLILGSLRLSYRADRWLVETLGINVGIPVLSIEWGMPAARDSSSSENSIRTNSGAHAISAQ